MNVITHLDIIENYRQNNPKEFVNELKLRCYLSDVENGTVCCNCYTRIRRTSKNNLFKGKASYRKRRPYKICLQCYEKEKTYFLNNDILLCLFNYL